MADSAEEGRGVGSPKKTFRAAALIVHEDVLRDELLKRVIEISNKLVFGDPLNEASRFGPMISAAHLDKIEHSALSPRCRRGRYDRYRWPAPRQD